MLIRKAIFLIKNCLFNTKIRNGGKNAKRIFGQDIKCIKYL